MNYAAARTHMVDSQIYTSGVISPALLEAFKTIPRENFVPEALKNVAYKDEEITLGDNRFLLEPMTFSKMLQAVDLKPDDVVLDIGAATGYSSAILSSLVSTVVALEENEDYLVKANSVWSNLDLCNIVAQNGSLTGGYAEKAPFDLILINGAVDHVPQNLLDQLAPNGRMITIIKEGGQTIGNATLIQNLGENQFSSYNLFNAGCPYLPGFEPKPAFSF